MDKTVIISRKRNINHRDHFKHISVITFNIINHRIEISIFACNKIGLVLNDKIGILKSNNKFYLFEDKKGIKLKKYLTTRLYFISPITVKLIVEAFPLQTIIDEIQILYLDTNITIIDEIKCYEIKDYPKENNK